VRKESFVNRVKNKLGVLLLVAPLLAAIALPSCAKQSKGSPLPAEALVVDVRTEAEFREEHFPGAKNIPLGNMTDRLEEFGPKDKPVVVYCHSGSRSLMAKAVLKMAGYELVINGGGLNAMMRYAKTPVPAAEASP
jgi:phage shock protein E